MPELRCMKAVAGKLPPETEVILVMEPSKWWRRMQIFKEFVWDFRVPRNYEHHKKFFALIKIVFDNTDDRFTSEEHLRAVLTIWAGWVNEDHDTEGNLTVTPKSISFSSMDQAEFEKYYNDVINAVLRELMPTMLRQELEEEIIRF